MRKIERQGKVSAHAEVCRNFLQMNYAPFHREWLIKFSAKTEFRQIRMSRERGREMERERGIWGKGGGREREREEGEGQDNVYNLCSFCHIIFRKGGSSEETNSGKSTYKNKRIGKRT